LRRNFIRGAMGRREIRKGGEHVPLVRADQGNNGRGGIVNGRVKIYLGKKYRSPNNPTRSKKREKATDEGERP